MTDRGYQLFRANWGARTSAKNLTIQDGRVYEINAATNELVSNNPGAPAGTAEVNFVFKTCIEPLTSLVSWWTGDETPNDSWGQNHGTLMNGAAYADGQVGSAFALNTTTNDYVDVGDRADLRVSGSHSVFAWVKLDETIEEDLVSKFAQVSSSQYTREFLLMVYGGRIRGHIGSTTVDGGLVTPDEWHHVGQVWNGSTLKVYLDGVLSGSVSAPTAPQTGSTPFLIGARSHDGQSMRTSSDMDGLIDEVQVYNEALTDAQILAAYNAGKAGFCK